MALPAALAALAALFSGVPALPHRPGRWQGALLLVALVLGWHVWLAAQLAGQLADAAPPPGLLRPGQVQLRSLPAAPPALPVAAWPAPAAEAAATAAPPQPPAMPAAQAAAAPADDRLPGVASAVTTGAPTGAPTGASTGAPTGATPPAPPEPADLRPAAQVADQAAALSADADAGLAGEPPPLYRAQLPPPAQRRYALRLNGQLGEALLVWQHDGQRYRLTLDGQGVGGAPLLSQASAGQIDAHGLAPDRYVDSRRGGRAQAANFRRDIGRIGYSGPPQQHPAWPGAQDRLSWLVQLAAVLAAAEGPPPEVLRLFVTDARGHAGLWQLQRQPDTAGPTPWGEALLQHWLREPPRPEGLRVEVWLAVPAGPSAGASAGASAMAWPVRLRLQVPRSGDVVELQLLAAP